MSWQRFRKTKFGNKQVSHAGLSFHSKAEASLYDELYLMQQAGLIRELKCQDTVYLTRARIMYKPDFSAFDVGSNEKVYYEFKGYETPEWRIKKRLWKEYGPGRLKIYKGSAKKIYLVEEIVPHSPADVLHTVGSE